MKNNLEDLTLDHTGLGDTQAPADTPDTTGQRAPALETPAPETRADRKGSRQQRHQRKAERVLDDDRITRTTPHPDSPAHLRNADLESRKQVYPPAHTPAEGLKDGLLQQIFRIASHERRTGLVVALTSVDPRAGVTYLADTLAEELGSDNGGNVVCIDCRILTELQTAGADEKFSYTGLATLLQEDRLATTPHWQDSYSAREAIIARLRARFQYVLIACPSLKESSDVLGIAPMVDGVIVVVEANGTRTRQIAVIEKTIVAARGRILGHILNKRAYFIPAWVYSRLAVFGI